MHVHSTRNSNHDDQTSHEENFTESTMPLALAEIFGDINAYVHSVCGS